MIDALQTVAIGALLACYVFQYRTIRNLHTVVRQLANRVWGPTESPLRRVK